MSEEEIRLDQTIKVFDTIADLISKNETCSYRYLIYDLLGFEQGDYGELISGLAITNKLAECETQKEVIDKIKKYVNKEISLIDKDLSECELTYSEKYNFENAKNKYINILELLEEIE